MRWLAIDKDSQIAFLIFNEVIEVFLVEFPFLYKNETAPTATLKIEDHAVTSLLL